MSALLPSQGNDMPKMTEEAIREYADKRRALNDPTVVLISLMLLQLEEMRGIRTLLDHVTAGGNAMLTEAQ